MEKLDVFVFFICCLGERVRVVWRLGESEKNSSSFRFLKGKASHCDGGTGTTINGCFQK